jgi:adenylyltransferase/sulfurtransferase
MDNKQFSLFLRQMILDEVGMEGQKKIRNSKVLVVGAGGIGCPLITYLLRAGVGTLGIVDFDKVDITNIHRQFLYSDENAGQYKLDVLEKELSLYDFQKINFHKLKLDENNAAEIFRNYDLVIDGTDNFKTRYAVNDACVLLNKPLISASILGFQIQLFLFGQPSVKNLRYIYPEPPLPGEVPSCSENGVLGPVAGMAGMMVALEALKLILNIQSFKDAFLILDLKNWNLDKLSF